MTMAKTSCRHSKNKRCVVVCGLVILSFCFASFWYQYQGHHAVDYQDYFRRQIEEFAENETYDSQIPNKQRVLCMIMTRLVNWETKGKAVRNTWAQRCHKALFFYTKVDNCSSHSICDEPNAIGLDIPDGRDHLTAKTFGALIHSYREHASEVDYFFKADDDTYVIMENLQRILSHFNSTPLLYLGRRIDDLLPKGYNSGGAGYIISKDAVKLILLKGLSFPNDCLKDGSIEDYEIGKCLSKLGIFPQDELDDTGRLTFHSDNPLRVFEGDKTNSKYYFIDFARMQFGNTEATKRRGFMLSQWSATLHYVTPPEMYMYDFLLYQLQRPDDNDHN